MTRARCLVLGGAGFLGSHLARGLLESGHPVTVFDRPQVSGRSLQAFFSDVSRVDGDLMNEEDVKPLLADHPLVFHFVGSTVPSPSNANPVYDVETNVVGTLRLLDLCVTAGVERVIFPSSGGTVYGPCPRVARREDDATQPIASYGITKLAVEKYLELYRRLHGLEYLCFRFSNPYGRHQSSIGVQGAVTTFLERARRGEPLEIWGDGSVTRDYIHVEDAVSAVLRGLSYQGEHRLFNVGSGVGTSIGELVALIQRVVGRELAVRHRSARPADVPWNVLDCRRAQRELGWSPRRTLEEGVRALWEAMSA